MACPECAKYEKLYGFSLEKNSYYMTQVNEIKTCCPTKVYVTDFNHKEVKFVVNNKEYVMDKTQFYKSSWRLYDSF